MAKKRVSKNTPRVPETAKVNYLGSITHLHINQGMILAEKTGFLVAVSALILTLAVAEILNETFLEYALLIKLGIMLSALGSALSIILSLSAELTRPVKKVKSFHPLSLEEFHDEAKITFLKDIKKTCSKESAIIEDFSAQILAMKEDIYKKTKTITIAMYSLIIPLFIMTFLVFTQFYIMIFA